MANAQGCSVRKPWRADALPHVSSPCPRAPVRPPALSGRTWIRSSAGFPLHTVVTGRKSLPPYTAAGAWPFASGLCLSLPVIGTHNPSCVPHCAHTSQQDSFILAFHCAPDAVAFAVRAQAALLAQPWPQELLEAADVCYPVWVQVG